MANLIERNWERTSALTQKHCLQVKNGKERVNADLEKDVMGREVGGGFMFGNACTPVVDSCQRMAKPIQYCKVK